MESQRGKQILILNLVINDKVKFFFYREKTIQFIKWTENLRNARTKFVQQTASATIRTGTAKLMIRARDLASARRRLIVAGRMLART